MPSIEISIGPVQDFVARSRRTRDLWASSFLLSYLAAHVVRGLQEAGARIVRPTIVGDSLVDWVTGRGTGAPPDMGSLPNQLVARIDGDAHETVRKAKEAFDGAWEKVVSAVWAQFVQPVASLGREVELRWRRQTASFWEFIWTIVDDDHEGAQLARRKLFRPHWGEDEPGEKCSLFHDLEELSGYPPSTPEGRSAQKEFWKKLRKKCGTNEIKENERLSAIGLIKRLFPKVSETALGWSLEVEKWPSTLHVAAGPWVKRARGAAPEVLRRFADEVRRKVPDAFRTTSVRLESFEGSGLERIDPNLLFRESLFAERDEPSIPEGIVEALSHLLQDIEKAADGAGRIVGPPPSYYALVLADGDRLGETIGQVGAQKVSQAILAFSGKVDGIVRRHGGVTVYRGGDDVLALLPAESSIRCAEELGETFERVFREQGADASLSAGVVFAHIKAPLSAVLREGRWILDAVAKEGNGRSSVAVSLLQGGGRSCLWVSRWKREGRSFDVSRTLDDVVDLLGASRVEPGASSSMLYRLRDTLGLIAGWARWSPGAWASVGEQDLYALVAGTVSQSLRVEGPVVGAITDAIVRLLWRARSGEASDEIGLDGLVLARFLSRIRGSGVTE